MNNIKWRLMLALAELMNLGSTYLKLLSVKLDNRVTNQIMNDEETLRQFNNLMKMGD